MVARGSLGIAVAVTLALTLGPACKPKTEGRPSVIDTERVLALRAAPAEVTPDVPTATPIHFEALYVGPDATPDPSVLDWSICSLRKPLAVSGPTALECYAPAGKGIQTIGSGATVVGTIARDACRIFGPAPPIQEMGAPPARPADPDTTGGFYQPITVGLPGDTGTEYVVGVERLDCGLPGAAIEQSLEYTKRHRPNENPAIDKLSVLHQNGEKAVISTDPAAEPLAVHRGEKVTFQVNWAACLRTPECGNGVCEPGESTSDTKDPIACPADCKQPKRCTGTSCPALVSCGDATCSPEEDAAPPGDPLYCPDDCAQPLGCTGSERYLQLDPVKHELVDRRESIRVSWFATAGDFDHDRTGRTEDEANQAFSDNDWTAPTDSGAAHLWVILRDDRGGVGWSEFHVDVQP